MRPLSTVEQVHGQSKAEDSDAAAVAALLLEIASTAVVVITMPQKASILPPSATLRGCHSRTIILSLISLAAGRTLSK